MNTVESADRAAIVAVVSELADAWNAGDSERFAAPFADDGDQVNIFGMTLRGRAEIDARHRMVFDTIFRESVNDLAVDSVRPIASGALLARITSSVRIPHGPMQGTLQTRATLVFRKHGTCGWEIVTFHNTRVAP